MILGIKPFDTLFFGGSKPFNMGDDTLASGVFPPIPSTLCGVLRSAYIFQNGGLKQFLDGHMDQEIGTKDSLNTGRFKVKSVFFEKNGVKYFPLPLDMGLSPHKNNEAVILMQGKIPEGASTSMAAIENLIITDNPEITKPDPGEYFIAETHLECYFHGIRKQYPVSNINSFSEIEPKVGIKRGSTYASEEGKLYRVNMNRIKDDVLLAVEVEGLEKKELSPVLKIGAEGKSGFIQKEQKKGLADVFKLNKVIGKINTSNTFKVYFTTPGIFKAGWLPEFEGVNDKVELVAAAVGKPVWVGGWDMAKGRHKEMKKAVPAGSVFYYRVIDGNDINKITEIIHLKNHGEKKEEGFGHALVAAI